MSSRQHSAAGHADSTDFPDLNAEFRELAERYCSLARELDIAITPYHSEELPLYSQQPEERRQRAVELLRCQVEAAQAVLDEQGRLRDSSRLLWYGLRRFGLVPQPDIFGRMSAGDVITVYGANHELMFWNFEFFRFTSFTLEEITCSNWARMRRRDPAVMQVMEQFVRRVMSGQVRTTVDPLFPDHWAEEIGSARSLMVWVRMKFFSPLSRNGEFGGYITVNDASLM